MYLTTLRARLRCPAVLMVVCVDDGIATWCAAPIELGHPGAQVTPLVLGPDRVPMITDPVAAGRAPELAVLSAMAHGANPARAPDVLSALLGALAAVDEHHSTLYADVVLAALPLVARHCLEELMGIETYEYQSEFVRRYVFQGRAEGRAEGRAAAVLEVLDARGIVVSDAIRSRITDCHDIEQLDQWLRRAATADSANDLFA